MISIAYGDVNLWFAALTVQAARLLAQALGVPLANLSCDDDGVPAFPLPIDCLEQAAARPVIQQALTRAAWV